MITRSTQPTVVVYFDKPGRFEYPFNDPLYFASYKAFSAFAAKSGLAIYYARGTSYRGNMQFARGWEFVGDTLEEVAGPIAADLIYDKSAFGALVTQSSDRVLNIPEFDAIIRDKWRTYQTLRPFCPFTSLISLDTWREVATRVPGNRIVLKPRLGYGGVGVYILEKSTFDFPSLGLAEPYIAQEFIDSSEGIPGICAGYHDVRILLFNGEPRLSFVRTPKKGSLLSNVSQGGQLMPIDIKAAPKSMLEAASAIDLHFTRFAPRFYATDFFLQDGRPYLVEANPQPGLPHPDTEGPAFAVSYYANLVELFFDALKRT